MENFYCIIDKSGSMSVLDKGLIIKNLTRTINQVCSYLPEDEKFEMKSIEWDGNSESLVPLIQANKIHKFMIMTDGYSLDIFYNNSLKKKEFQKHLSDLDALGCIVLIGIDANEERISVVETFPAYCVLEALDYVLQK